MFKFKIEHIIIAVLAIVLLFKSCGKANDIASHKKKTTIKEKTITTVDSTSDTEIKNRVPEKVNVIEEPHQIRQISNPEDLSKNEQKKVKQVNRYQDTTILENARIYTDILSEGRILKKSVTAEIDHKETTITTKETTVKNASGLFISPGLGYSPVYGIETVEANLTYINKNSFGISAGVYYNTIQKSTGFKITLHKKIF